MLSIVTSGDGSACCAGGSLSFPWSPAKNAVISDKHTRAVQDCANMSLGRIGLARRELDVGDHTAPRPAEDPHMAVVVLHHLLDQIKTEASSC